MNFATESEFRMKSRVNHTLHGREKGNKIRLARQLVFEICSIFFIFKGTLGNIRRY